jgi:hypothetical protein
VRRADVPSGAVGEWQGFSRDGSLEDEIEVRGEPAGLVAMANEISLIDPEQDGPLF